MNPLILEQYHYYAAESSHGILQRGTAAVPSGMAAEGQPESKPSECAARARNPEVTLSRASIFLLLTKF